MKLLFQMIHLKWMYLLKKTIYTNNPKNDKVQNRELSIQKRIGTVEISICQAENVRSSSSATSQFFVNQTQRRSNDSEGVEK